MRDTKTRGVRLTLLGRRTVRIDLVKLARDVVVGSDGRCSCQGRSSFEKLFTPETPGFRRNYPDVALSRSDGCSQVFWRPANVSNSGIGTSSSPGDPSSSRDRFHGSGKSDGGSRIVAVFYVLTSLPMRIQRRYTGEILFPTDLGSPMDALVFWCIDATVQWSTGDS